MVTDNKYRWDFIGLSTDDKPTPATSDRVVDGSTFYCSDTSKLYVFCKDTWYEKTAGGGTYELPIASSETLGGVKVGTGLSINSETGVLSAEGGGGGGVVELTAADYNYPTNNPNSIAPWLLESGIYVNADTNPLAIRLSTNNSNTLLPGGMLFVQTSTDYNKSSFGIMDGNSTIRSVTNLTGSKYGGVGGNFLFTDMVQTTTGTSANLPMSQNATTSMVFQDATNKKNVAIDGSLVGTVVSGATAIGGKAENSGIAIGYNDNDYGAFAHRDGIAIGQNSVAGNNNESTNTVAIGGNAKATAKGSVAIGRFAEATTQGQFDIGVHNSGWQANTGYSGTAYRLLTGLYDGQSAHDAATLAQGNTLATSAPTTSTVGVLGQLYTDTTNMHTYQCTAISGDTYTWTQRW